MKISAQNMSGMDPICGRRLMNLSDKLGAFFFVHSFFLYSVGLLLAPGKLCLNKTDAASTLITGHESAHIYVLLFVFYSLKYEYNIHRPQRQR